MRPSLPAGQVTDAVCPTCRAPVRSDPAQAGLFELRCEACGASAIVLNDHPGGRRAAAVPPPVGDVRSAPHRWGARHVAGAVIVIGLLVGAVTGYLWNDHAARAARSSVGHTAPTAIAPAPVVAQPRFPG